MNPNLQVELERSKKRLAYYTNLKEKAASPIIDKWVTIYTDRAKKLETQLQRLAARKSTTTH